MPSSLRPPARLTDRDRELLAFAAEHRFVLAGHVARLLGLSERAARRRLGELQDAGLLSRTDRLQHESPAYAVTGRARQAIGSDLGQPRPLDLGSYRHDVGVTWLAAAARRGGFGEPSAVIGERRMRSEDRRSDRDPGASRHGVRMRGGGRESARRHYPDLVLVTERGHRIAFELELTTKQPARRERILSAYAADPRIDAVVYLVPSAAAARAIARSAATVGAQDRVRVQRFVWAGGRAPGEPPTASRAATRSRSRGASAPRATRFTAPTRDAAGTDRGTER